MTLSAMIPRPGQSPVDIASLNINVPPVPPPVAVLNPVNPGRDREAQLVRRVRELEEEVRVVRIENEKQVRGFFFVCLWYLKLWRVESHDRQIPRTMGEAEGVC